MRASLPACVLLIAAFASAPAFAQVPPPAGPEQIPPGQAQTLPSTTPVPPPTVLLPVAPPASDAAPAASDEAAAKPAPPPKRPRRTAAVIQALDKTTAETMRFEAPVGQPIRYKDLIFTVHACEDSAPELGQRGAAAHLEIQSAPLPVPGRDTPPTRQVFRGWMFANAPGLHPFEHPVYDAWLLGCRGNPAPSPEPPPTSAPAAPAK
jgi:hypothetical protein